ncbi:uncharacterized protein LOC104889848 isoform X2 [Beta vulgaris subsp. vulgaris]|uniref:uncharacterized protein LOC104889848 isoform X2 n=1 Tax=Beta vulgaris subsp. vulgaris TaxID=3555 RepID=UPI00053F6BF6|nr:uncharacterized protein LOC104889848 isoform X2 [Beta vulgaris subsp. vulgaris]
MKMASTTFSACKSNLHFHSRRKCLNINVTKSCLSFSQSQPFFSLHKSSISKFPTSLFAANSKFQVTSFSGDRPLNNTVEEEIPQPSVHSCIWKWRGYSIRYQCCGNTGPALLLIHGFGANSDHWRKNLPVLGMSHRVYSIDLIGYGYSDKPNPRDFGLTPFYTFETWASQLNDFCLEVVKDEAFFICNSIGGLVGLQAAVMEPQICKGLVLLNISLRMLHIKKQPPLGRPLIKGFQNLLRNTDLGKLFFGTVATPQSVRNILCQVTEELVEKILLPGLQPGAVDVFLEFICYSDGPLPEELLPQVKCPVLIGWGDKDPWEPIELGRAYGNFESVEDFIVLPGVGHCPQDEAPDLVNPLVESFVERHSGTRANVPSESLV